MIASIKDMAQAIGIEPKHYLPAWFMIQYLIASAVYKICGDAPRAAYWLFALGLTYVVTFLLK